jgi:hypothetical protein
MKPLFQFITLFAVLIFAGTVEFVRASKQTNTQGGMPAVPDCQDASGNHLNFTSASNSFSCGSTAANARLTGTTGSIGGSLLSIGGAASGTATVSGAIVGQPCEAQASDGTNVVALGVTLGCTVTASNTVTVTETAIVALTPPSKTFNVRVFP